MRDVRLAVRTLSRRRGLALTAVLSLALGIGANSAIFSIVDAVILRPLPDRLVVIEESKNGESSGSNPARLADWAREVADLEATAGFYGEGLVLTGQGDPVRLHAIRTVGEGLWHRRFGGDPRLLGRTLRLRRAVSRHRLATLKGLLPAETPRLASADLDEKVALATADSGVRVRLLGGFAGLALWLGLSIVLGGLVLGLFGAAALGRSLGTLLFGVEPVDGPVLLTVSAVMLTVAGIASYLPALRAAGVDPGIALRHE